MAESNKRLLTDDIHNSHVASDQLHPSSGTPDELTQRLRNAGARVRKSVMEGYRTTPSSFSKAQSTGSIFRSMNDTLRDVYANASGSVPSHNVIRKRARSVSEADPDSITEEYEISAATTTHASETAACAPSNDTVQPIPTRQIKPLRAPSRALLETRSLPATAFSFGAAKTGQPSAVMPVAYEDDWSQENSFQPSQVNFEPMNFE